MGRTAKLTQAEVDDVRWFYRNTPNNQAQIARMFRVSPTVISRVLDGKYTPKPKAPPQPAQASQRARRRAEAQAEGWSHRQYPQQEEQIAAQMSKRYWFAKVTYDGKSPFHFWWGGTFSTIDEMESCAAAELQRQVDAAWATISPHPGPRLLSVIPGRLVAEVEGDAILADERRLTS